MWDGAEHLTEQAPEPVHACPANGEGVTGCCRRTPFELGVQHVVTTDPTLVTCTGPAVVSDLHGLAAREAGAELPDGTRFLHHIGPALTAPPAPTIGRIVHYRLHAHDVESIAHRAATTRVRAYTLTVGQLVPGLVVVVNGDGSVNLRLFLDADFDVTVRGRARGDEAGRWRWPERV